MTMGDIVKVLIFQQMVHHPLPWRVEKDWLYEVTAPDGHVVAKCETSRDAQEIIDIAEKIEHDLLALRNRSDLDR